MSQLSRVELSPDHKRRWIETRSALLWQCPAFTHILFSLLNPEQGEMAAVFTDDPNIPIAATDGANLIINPVGFFALPLAQRVFVVAHEIMHCIYNHCAITMPMQRSKKIRYPDGKEFDYDHRTMNIAMDLVINDALIESKIGQFPPMGCHDKSTATEKDGFLDVYRKIYDPQKGKAKGGLGDGSGFDVILAPGTGQGQDPGAAAQGRSAAEWSAGVAAAIAAAKAQGKLPASLERLLGKVLEPEIAWQELIRSFFSRKVGGGSFDWRRPDKRLIQRDIFAPRRSGNGCGEVVVTIDTSGSIGQRELDIFFGELRGIIEDVKPERIYLIWCDAKVHQVDELEDAADLDGLKPHGGGGTDFRPPFDWVYEQGLRPEAMVYLTDGYGTFPNDPGYPVLWGDISGSVRYPFGDVVAIPLKRK